MLADFVLKGIDNLFNQKMSLQPQKKMFTKDMIKQNLQNVVRKSNADHNVSRQINQSPKNKSRLKAILEHNKQEKIRSVVKRNKNGRSSSPNPYTKIQRGPSMKTLKSCQLNESQSTCSLKKQQSLIKFYRQQRKTIQKSRLTQNSIQQKSRSRIFRFEDAIITANNTSYNNAQIQNIQIPAYKRFAKKD